NRNFAKPGQGLLLDQTAYASTENGDRQDKIYEKAGAERHEQDEGKTTEFPISHERGGKLAENGGWHKRFSKGKRPRRCRGAAIFGSKIWLNSGGRYFYVFT